MVAFTMHFGKYITTINFHEKALKNKNVLHRFYMQLFVQMFIKLLDKSCKQNNALKGEIGHKYQLKHYKKF